jgi:hypothetical protein
VTPGIALCEHTDAAGELVFRQACAMGLEGIVSKRLAAPYRSGPSGDWIKGQEPGQPGDGKNIGIVMPSGGRIFAFFCSARDHKPQNSECVYTS